MSENVADMLPGLAHSHLPGTPGPLLQQARAAMQSLFDKGRLEDAGAQLTAQLVLSLAEAVDRGLGAGRVSVSTATLARQLQEAIGSLPEPDAGAGDDDATREFWRTAAGL